MYLSCNEKKIEIEDCTTFWKRLIGFMFQKKKIISGKRFPNCNSIHTFFMFQKIDVIMTDRNYRIIKMYPNLKSWRMIFPQKNIYYTYELPLGVCKNYTIGNTLVTKETD